MEEGGSSSIELKARRAELRKTNEDLKRAKDEAIESWLNSRPLIDELEKLQIGLTTAKKRTATPNAVVLELESQLGVTVTKIKYNREEELIARKMIDEINDALEETREDLEHIKAKRDEERCERLKLKQVLRMRRQTLHALQLNYRALRLELEAFAASATTALEHINRSQNDNTTVQLSSEEYEALIRAADEETFLSDWRVSVTTEHRLVAQESRDLALERFKKLSYSDDRSKENKIEDEITVEQEKDDSSMANGKAKLLVEETGKSSSEQVIAVQGSSSDGKKNSDRGKKPSVFAQLQKFVVNIT